VFAHTHNSRYILNNKRKIGFENSSVREKRMTISKNTYNDRDVIVFNFFSYLSIQGQKKQRVEKSNPLFLY
jgi:hypothetical protein